MARKILRKSLLESILLFIFVLLFFSMVGFAGRWFYMVDNTSTIRLGVLIEDMDVGGMSLPDAREAVNDWTIAESDEPLITVGVENHMDTLSIGQGLIFDVETAVKSAYKIGRKGNFARNFIETLMTRLFTENITVTYALNPDGIIDFATEYSQNFYVEGEDAQLLGATLNQDGNIEINLLPAIYAKTIDPIAIYNACISTFDVYGLGSIVALEPVYVPPAIKDDTILGMANKTLQFGYSPSNIDVAYLDIISLAEQVGVIVLMPQDSFSLNDRLEKNPDSIYNSINLPTIIMGAALRGGLTIIDRTAVITDLPLGYGQTVMIDETSDLKLLNETDTPIIIWIGADPSHIYANASCFYEEGISYSQITSIHKGDDYTADEVEVWRVYFSDKNRERYRELLWTQSID